MRTGGELGVAVGTSDLEDAEDMCLGTASCGGVMDLHCDGVTAEDAEGGGEHEYVLCDGWGLAPDDAFDVDKTCVFVRPIATCADSEADGALVPYNCGSSDQKEGLASITCATLPCKSMECCKLPTCATMNAPLGDGEASTVADIPVLIAAKSV
jgi:hypothetical protein